MSLTLDEYLRLLDYSRRQVRAGKRGAIPAGPVLERLGIEAEQFVDKRKQRYTRGLAAYGDTE